MENLDLIDLLKQSGIGMINGYFRTEDLAEINAKFTNKNDYKLKVWVRLSTNDNIFIGQYQLKVDITNRRSVSGTVISGGEEEGKFFEKNYPAVDIRIDLKFFNEISGERGTFTATSSMLGRPKRNY